MINKVQFWELTQLQYDNLETKDPYTFYETPSNAYLGDKILTNTTSTASSTSINGTLTSSGWDGSSAPYSQTLTVSGLTSSQNGILGLAQGATQAQMEAAAAAMIGISSQSSDSIVVVAFGEKPTIDIPITIILL